MSALVDIRIEGPFDRPEEGAVEVVVRLADGAERWCFFMDPARLAAVGDLVEGTDVRVHLGVPHGIVVSELTADVIGRVLRQLDRDGLLLAHTAPVEA